MEHVIHSVLASRVLLHIRHRATNNNRTAELTDLQSDHASDLTNTMTLQDKNSRKRYQLSHNYIFSKADGRRREGDVYIYRYCPRWISIY